MRGIEARDGHLCPEKRLPQCSAMEDIMLKEGHRRAYPYTMKYDPLYSIVAKRNTPILRSDLTNPGVFFNVKTKESDTNAWLILKDDVPNQITWEDEAAGKILINFNTNTLERTGDNQFYELRVKLSDGSYLTVDSGRLHILESIVDNP
jgi:hypothetical protein